jgi:hypothetical protein
VDDETIALVRQLCCRAGTMMEDVSPMAVASPTDGEQLRVVAAGLAISIGRMSRIISAANSLMGQ